MENITVDDSTMKDYFKNKKARYKTLNDYDPAYNDYEDQARQHTYFEKSHLFLEKKIQLLKQENTVHINDEVLDTVSVIDFKKSRWANLFLYNNSGRMTIPIIDPTWGIASIDRMQN
jgi:CRISPR/Cas system-associated protein Csm6